MGKRLIDDAIAFRQFLNDGGLLGRRVGIKVEAKPNILKADGRSRSSLRCRENPNRPQQVCVPPRNCDVFRRCDRPQRHARTRDKCLQQHVT